MIGESKEGAVDPRQLRSSDVEVDRYRAERQRPKTVTRPPTDKMARPAAGRGYETK
ncbi:hypothetical protein [Methylobacterium longum]|uniref:Uncharacterized protein n=1 Tax=Methylobacterium longum TaxID=767694 RepID=A0ABT8APY5_9HYPH|nr:hypothetical protein [Methylobacterium longum]MDN3571815.1 hypothetical protein [Methylobacterium longum]GJE14016.1 hypothetical protein FOHLNKBM_5085 [Methylobacterium longum]